MENKLENSEKKKSYMPTLIFFILHVYSISKIISVCGTILSHKFLSYIGTFIL